jgi:hypothetical protein
MNVRLIRAHPPEPPQAIVCVLCGVISGWSKSQYCDFVSLLKHFQVFDNRLVSFGQIQWNTFLPN